MFAASETLTRVRAVEWRTNIPNPFQILADQVRVLNSLFQETSRSLRVLIFNDSTPVQDGSSVLTKDRPSFY